MQFKALKFGQFSPQSVRIAGIVTAGLVIIGFSVAQSATSDQPARPAVVSRVDPGPAAVELAEAVPPSPAAPTSAPTPVAAPKSTPTPEPVEADDEDAEEVAPGVKRRPSPDELRDWLREQWDRRDDGRHSDKGKHHGWGH